MMKKYILLLFITQSVIACTSNSENYYLDHPHNLRKAVQACPATPPKHFSCEQIIKMEQRMQDLAYALQENPQQFGIAILAIQQTIAKQQAAMTKGKDVTTALAGNQQELLYRLAVVRWLESPRK
jgi:hypothetical protein